MEYVPFVFWRPSKAVQDRIMSDYGERVVYCQTFHVTPEERYRLVCDVYQRDSFNPDSSKLRKNKPITVIIIKDDSPEYGIRCTRTNKKRKNVNTTFFDLKKELRKEYDFNHFHVPDNQKEENDVFKAFGLEEFIVTEI